MSTAESHAGSFRRRLLLPAFVLSSFIGSAGYVLLTTLLVDMASSLKVPIGTAGQLVTIVGFSGLFFGLALGALTIRFKLKSLFLLGLALNGGGALGLFFAPTFVAVLFPWLLMGLGGLLVGIMVSSLIGALLPLEKRGWAIGLTSSTLFFATVFGAPLFGFIGKVAGWRSTLVWFILPYSVACAVLCFLVIPSKQQEAQPPPKSEYLKAFKQIFSNKSAVACLTASTLSFLLGPVTMYGVSFYRMSFLVDQATGGLFASVAAIGGIFGAVGGGRLINRCGRKTLTVAAFLLEGVFAILFTLMPIMWVSVAFWAAASFSGAMTTAALTSLLLEQVPEFRASMMSISVMFGSVGAILAAIISGALLNLYANNFQLIMTVFGVAGLAGAFVVLLFAKDPCKARLPSSGAA